MRGPAGVAGLSPHERVTRCDYVQQAIYWHVHEHWKETLSKRTNLQLKVRKRFDGFQCCGNIEQGHKRVETKGDLVVYMPLTITRGD
jgi:hypothetical protein